MSKKKPKSKRKKPIPDVNVETTDSTNTAVVIGDKNVVNQNADQSIDILPDDNDLTNRVGKWIMMHVFGRLDHSMKLYGVLTTLVAGAIAYPAFQPALLIQWFGESSFPMVWYAFLIPLIVTLALGPLLFVESHQSTCPKCGFKFSWINTKRTLKKHAVLSDREIRNERATYQCTNPKCRFKRENVPEIYERRFSSD